MLFVITLAQYAKPGSIRITYPDSAEALVYEAVFSVALPGCGIVAVLSGE